MKKILLMLSLFIITALTFSSCTKIETVELNERLIIEAIGIDAEDGKYKVTIEGLDSYTAGNDSSSISGESITKRYLFEGDTIGMAMNSISVITGQIPLFSQARVLILGMDTAINSLSEVLDFFRREYTTRTDILIAVAEDKAADVVSADFGKNVSAGNTIESAIQSYKYTGISAYTPLYRFLNAAISETDTAYCPVIGTKKNAYSEQSEVNIIGTVVLGKTGHMILSKEETLAMMIMNNEIENGDLMLNTEKGKCTLEIVDCKTKINTSTNDKNVTFSVTTELTCDIPEYQTTSFEELTKNDTEIIAKKTSEKICGMIFETVDKTFYTNGYDIFSFGRRINLKDSDLYNYFINNSKNFSEYSACDISVKVSIRRIGKVVLEKE